MKGPDVIAKNIDCILFGLQFFLVTFYKHGPKLLQHMINKRL